MNDAEPDLSVNGKADALERALGELDRRVQKLETRVASLPDEGQIEARVTQRVRASLPPAPPPVDPTEPPSLKDITLPFPTADTIMSTAKTTWAIFEMVNELKTLFWMMVDRRYHMAWLTRVVAIILLVAILTSQFWLPLAFDNVLGRTWEKIINLSIGFVMFMMLHYEMRRYQQWRGRR